MKKSIIIGTVGSVLALAEQYPLQVVALEKDNTAEIRISGVIHSWENSSKEFKQKIDAMIAKGIKDVKLYINSPGGSVFEANEIANEIQRFDGTITGFGGALVASAASYLAIICDSFEMPENGQYMYHKPIGFIQGNEDRVASDLKLLQNLTAHYRTAYSEKTGLPEDTIESNWSKGDVWLSAKQAKEQGFITSVSTKKEKITTEQKALFVACGAPVIPEIEKLKNEHKMTNRNQIIAMLKLSADATDEQIEAAVAEAMRKADAAEANSQASEEQRKQMAETMVQGFIDAKQTTADLKEQWVKMALIDFSGTKAILEKLPKAVKVSDHLEDEPVAGREKWTMEDYQEKDPEALKVMMTENPEQFKKLEAEYFGK